MRFRGERLRELREAQGWNPTRLGVELYNTGFLKRPVPGQRIQLYESGELNPNAATLTALVQVFDSPAPEWWNEEESAA